MTEHVIAYQKRFVQTGEAFELCPLDLPPQSFETEAVWFCPESGLLGDHERMERATARLAQPFLIVVVDDRRARAERGARRGDDLFDGARYVRVRCLAGRAVDRRFDDQGLHGLFSTASSASATPPPPKPSGAVLPFRRNPVTTLTGSRSAP